MALPTSPFDATKSLYAGLSIIEFTPTSGAKQTFESKKLDHKDNSKTYEIKRPDAKGVQRTVRVVRIEGGEYWVYHLDEAKRLIEIFSGALAGLVTGVCTIWEPDPSDATGKVAMKSEVGFPCTITREGDLAGGDGKASETGIRITSNKSGDVTFTADTTVS